MKAVRLGLEEWSLSEPICDALEGFYGNRIDGASLDHARELRDKIWALKHEIERLSLSGASPRQVCNFVAGCLAGQSRAVREVSKRTEMFIGSVEKIEFRMERLRLWLAAREQDYRSGRVCARCGYRHSELEYRSGYRDDGTGRLNCFGFARIKLEELQEERKLALRREHDFRCATAIESLPPAAVQVTNVPSLRDMCPCQGSDRLIK
ncbi:MAG: hypothetical protein QW376_07745 [Candidatus Caldarchaeum sp.]